MKKRIMPLMAGMLLLLTACGQTGSNSASKMLPVAAVQSAAQAIAPAGDGTQRGAENSPTVETVEETQDAGGKENSKPANDAETPSDKTEETPSAPAETAPPAAPKEPAIPAPAPEDKPAPAPTPVPTPAEEKQEEEPAPTPKPAASGNIYSIAEAVRVGNEYARAQYGVIIDTSMTAADSSFFPGTADSVAWTADRRH